MTNLGAIPANRDLALSDDVLPTGLILAWPSSTTPGGNWLMCDGASYVITAQQKLYDVISTAYNTAAGLQAPAAGRFRVPPLVGATVSDSNVASVGRTPVGILSGTDTIAGPGGGSWDHVHDIGNLSVPMHTHDVNGPDGQMRTGDHRHDWRPTLGTHYHSIGGLVSDYYYRSNDVAITVINNNITSITTPLVVSNTSQDANVLGVLNQDVLIYGNSGTAANVTGLSGNTTVGNGPFTGVYFYIKAA